MHTILTMGNSFIQEEIQLPSKCIMTATSEKRVKMYELKNVPIEFRMS